MHYSENSYKDDFTLVFWLTLSAWLLLAEGTTGPQIQMPRWSTDRRLPRFGLQLVVCVVILILAVIGLRAEALGSAAKFGRRKERQPK
jgi:hypothetical protein